MNFVMEKQHRTGLKRLEGDATHQLYFMFLINRQENIMWCVMNMLMKYSAVVEKYSAILE